MLKKLLTATLWIFLAFPVAGALAQTGTVAGTVTDSTDGTPVPGVNVIVQGTQIGAATGPNGAFEIPNVPTGPQTLVASFIGYDRRSVRVNVSAGETTTQDILLAPSTVTLQDVVVTALGVEREERSLGYSAEAVQGADLEKVPDVNFVSSLTGKVSGAQITNSNQMGGSTRIVLRGASSIDGNNQPLIVIDGVPLDNSNFTSTTQENGGGGFDYGNAASMVNPSNVQSVSVLKGPTAAALYGSRASNGVIQITTKNGSGRQGIGVTVNSSVTAKSIYGLPDYQNEYGGGGYAPFGTITNEDGEQQLIADFGTDESWGPRLDGRLVRQWYSFDNVNGLMGTATPWVAHPNNVEDFYETGVNTNNTIAFTQGGDNYNYRLSLSNIAESGVSPNSSLGREEVSFNGSADLTDRLRTSLGVTYLNESAKARPGTGYDNAVNPFLQFNQFGQRQIALGKDSYLNDFVRPDGTQRAWNWAGPAGARAGVLQYANSPYWITSRNYEEDGMNRVYGNFSIGYDLTDALVLSGNVRSDYYTSRRQERAAVGSIGVPGKYAGTSGFEEAIREVNETNASLELNYEGDLSENVSLTALAGSNVRYNSYSRNINTTQGGLSTAEVYTVENSISRPTIDDYFQEKEIYSFYGDVTVGYQDMLYLEGTLRNDVSSTLPEDNNSYLYPSVNASFVFSDLAAFQNTDALSFGKVRVGWAQVGNDTDPYRLNLTYPGGVPFGSSPLQSLPYTLSNPTLKPELTSGWEFGTQLQFFNNRIGLDATYYTQSTRNQILGVEVSRSSGYGEVLLNAGELTNRGVELSLTTTPLLTESLRWDVNVNWAKNVNTVEKLSEDLDNYVLGGPPFGPDVVARVDEPYGTFFGRGFAVDSTTGQRIISVDPDGNFVGYQATSPQALGSYVPDWTAGLSTTLAYKGLSLSAVFDGQKGGKMWSLTNYFGVYSGITEETVAGNVREVGLIPEGVYEDPATGEMKQWTDRVDANSFFKRVASSIDDAFLYDATYIKLRELSVAYTLPQRWFGSVPVQGLTLSLVGRNLATLLKYTPNIDPSTALSAGNAQGFEVGQFPPTRSYGLNLRLTL